METDEQYRSIVENLDELVCRFRPDGTLTFANAAYCRFFGLDPVTCTGTRQQILMPSGDRALLAMHLSSLTPENPAGVIEHRVIMPSGDIRWQQWSDRAIVNAGGEVTEYQSVGRDITEKKRTERALEETNQKLTLLSDIARHDISNRLNVLTGALGMLELQCEDPGRKHWVAMAVRAGKQIRNQVAFTKQFRDIGTKNAWWQDIYETVTAVRLDGDYSLVSVDQRLKGIGLFADPLLRTVFTNLFDNTMMHGGNVSRIDVYGSADHGQFTLLVEDDGIGIPAADKERIFKQGFGNNTGLGLFLVQEVLASSGISIRETGESGRGARFEIRIPQGLFRNSSR